MVPIWIWIVAAIVVLVAGAAIVLFLRSGFAGPNLELVKIEPFQDELKITARRGDEIVEFVGDGTCWDTFPDGHAVDTRTEGLLYRWERSWRWQRRRQH